MTNIKSVTAACLAAAALATLPALGAPADVPSDRVPVQLTQGQVTYMSGGIGSDEAEAMRGEESRFPLSLEFIRHADPRDQYLAGVFIEIKDARGHTALNAIADGPILLATLPDGKYSITADLDGETRSRAVEIAANKPKRVVFEW